MAGLNLVTAPGVEPVTLTEVKNALRADASTADDTYITNLATAARLRCEAYTRRAFITQTWELAIDSAPATSTTSGFMPWQQGGAYVTLPYAPLQSVTSFTSYADDDTPTVFSSSNYHVDTYTTPGRVVLKLGQVWPGYRSYLRTVNGIIIRYVVGYGDAAANVPEALRQAVIEETRALYEGWDYPQPSPQACRLMESYRVFRSLDG